MRALLMRERVFEVLATYKMRKLCDGTWLVTSPQGKVYAVDPAQGTCSCPNHVFLHVPCKHLLAVLEMLKAEQLRQSAS